MTELNQQTIESGEAEADLATNEGVDIEEQDAPEALDDDAEQSDDIEADEGDDELPTKFKNALNRKQRAINKKTAQNYQLKAQLRELEKKLESMAATTGEPKKVNPDDYDTVDDWVNALMDSKQEQSQAAFQKQQLQQQKEALQAQRDQAIIEQANEVRQVLTDFDSVVAPHVQLLDALPEQIADIFYSIDNPNVAIYTLAKEGKLQGLLYANPAIAAYEIVNAQTKGLEQLSGKPKPKQSQAPQPISKARGTGTVKKQLTPNDDVLKSLGLKKR